MDDAAKKTRVLLVDDDEDLRALIGAGLKRRDYEVVTAGSGPAALQELTESTFDAVVTDYEMGEMNGLELCNQALEIDPNLPVVMLTGVGSMDVAIGAIRAGAYDFVAKPVQIDSLAVVIDRAADHGRLRREVVTLREQVQGRRVLRDIIGQSEPIRAVGDLISRIASSDVNVLICGESGTGKELVADALHGASGRDGKFVAVNCAAMPEQLLESELFGHVRGAFTDAKTDRKGLFVEASGGTIFLDEIGEMPLTMQPKLLRALQERKVRPVGGDGEVPFDARVVSATNRDLEAEVEADRFREDLFYRINVVRIDVPPLRARGGDVLVLAQHFIEQAAARTDRDVRGLSSEAAQRLLDYSFPGNVRELENAIERAVALARFSDIAPADLPKKISDFTPERVVVESEDPSDLLSMDEVERRYIRKVLRAVGGNKTKAAGILGLDRKTLYRKLERYEAEADSDA